MGFLVSFAGLESSAKADAWGAPGIPHRWPPGLKQAIGTAYENQTAHSPVWFTVAQGILTETFYPTVDQAQIGDLQFLVTDGHSFFSEQKNDTVSQVSFSNEGMAVHISGQDKTGRYFFEQDIVADSAAPVVRIHTTFKRMQPGLKLFILFKPAIHNAGANNLGFAERDGLFATKLNRHRKDQRDTKPVHAALLSSVPWVATSAGYVGFSDGWQDLSRHYRLTEISPDAGPGNIALTGELRMSNQGSDFTYDLALALGHSRTEAQTYAQTSLTVPFDRISAAYENGWKSYIQTLADSPLLKNRRFFNESFFTRRSAQIIKMHEDKLHPGAIVASLSNPGLLENGHAMDGTGGYHVIWCRDVYHAAMGLLAAGDMQTPSHVLRYLGKNQKSNGSWPQNFWVDGSPYWLSLQLDEVAYPILLAAQLHVRGATTLNNSDLEMVRKAANFIIQNGPTTPMERWEELGGYSPNTIAVEIAALRMATFLTGDPGPAQVAERWQSLVETWTMVQKGPLGNDYYLRISPTGNPDEPEPIELPGGNGKAFAAEMIDGGFLALVRYRVRTFNDPRIVNTLQIYESPLLGLALADPGSPGSMAYRRYNGDVYGTGKVGGYWPLLAGERGHYAVEAKDWDRATAELFTLERSALPSDLLPEQTQTATSSQGLGTASPLVWAHAEDILLHRSIEEGEVFDSPPIPHPSVQRPLPRVLPSFSPSFDFIPKALKNVF